MAFTGTLAQDPRIAPSGKVGQLRVAISNGKDDAGHWRESTYIDVKTFGDLARASMLYRKGDRVFINGRLGHESWDDKTTGAKRTKLVMVASEMRALVAPAGTEGGSQYKSTLPDDVPVAPAGGWSEPGAEGDDDDIPF